MIRHIVLIKFQPSVSEDEIAALWDELHGFSGQIDGLSAVHAGRSESPEKIERGYMHGFTIDFDSWAALATYADHPAHKAFGGKLVANAAGGIDGILVFDLET